MGLGESHEIGVWSKVCSYEFANGLEEGGGSREEITAE